MTSYNIFNSANYIKGPVTEKIVNELIDKQKGEPYGVVPLDGNSKISSQYLDALGLNYKGLWDALTNTPLLSSGIGVQSYYYIISVNGSTNLDGITDWITGDWALFNGTIWQKLDQTDTVISVAGKIGAVVLDKSDVGLSNVDNLKNNLVGIIAPTTTDDITVYQIGSIWINTVTDKAYICVDNSLNAAVWKETTLEGGVSGDIVIDSIASTGGSGVSILTNNSIEPADPLYSGYVNSQIGGATNPYQEVNANTIHTRRYLQNATWRDGQIYLYSNDPLNPNPTIGLYGGSTAYPGYIHCHRLRSDYISASTSSVVIVDTDLACKIGTAIQSSLRFGEDFSNGFYQATPFSISYSNGTEEKIRFADGINIRNSAFNKMGIYFGADNPTLTGIFQQTAGTFGFASNGVTRLTIGNNSDVEISNSPLKLFAGNIGDPGVNWGDATTGFYRPALNQIAATISSAQRLLINSSGITVTGTATLPTISTTTLTASSTITSAVGSAASPAIIVGGSCGFHRINTTTLGISTGGAARLYIDSSAMTLYQNASKPGGGLWGDSSDFRLKTNISEVINEDCLNRVSSLKVKTYQYTEEAAIELKRNPLKIYTGMIAQDYYGVYTTATQNTTPLTINGVEDQYLNLDTTVAYFEIFGALKALKIRDEAKDILIAAQQANIDSLNIQLADILVRLSTAGIP